MATDILAQEFVQTAIEAEKSGIEFPIDFDDVWVASGYASKGNAIRFLTKRCDGLKLGIHYQLADRRTASKGTPERLCHMTIDAMKFFLARCNTEQGDSALWHFIEVEKVYLRSLEALFSAPSVDRIAELEASLAKSTEDRHQFPITLDLLHRTCGIVNKSQVKAAIKRDFAEDRDYIEMQDGFIYISEPTYHILMISFRSLKGADISGLPAILPIATEAYFQYQKMRQINSRVARREDENPDQLNLLH